MKRRLITLVLLLSLLMLPGCLYVNIGNPVPMTIDNGVKAAKVGEACQTMLLGLIFTGDATVDAAKKAGGITKVHNVDTKMERILGSIYAKQCTLVYGE
ncbi:MAG: hypothetical protein D6795_14870 [Deltaproteobacteria bacterium]|nr:MAG: hypothetical protein D6795_14870 [Deltaproteobacteria bacterium]